MGVKGKTVSTQSARKDRCVCISRQTSASSKLVHVLGTPISAQKLTSMQNICRATNKPYTQVDTFFEDGQYATSVPATVARNGTVQYKPVQWRSSYRPMRRSSRKQL